MRSTWSEDLATNITSIDRQHRELLEELRRYAAGTKTGFSQLAALNMLDVLDGHLLEHFANEEGELWDSYAPNARDHVADHWKLNEQMAELRQELGSVGPSEALLRRGIDRLVHGIVQHIETWDRELAAHLRKRAAADPSRPKEGAQLEQPSAG